MINCKTAVYLLIAFIWSWTFWFIGLRILSDGLTDVTLSRFITFFSLGVYGPTVSAISSTFFFEGFPGVLDLFKKVFRYQASWMTYMFVIIFPVTMVASGLILYAIFVGNLGTIDKNAWVLIPIVLLRSLVFGPLGEELGWRGLLLPELQKKHSNLTSSLIIGPIWYCWHIPLFFAPFGTLVSGPHHTFIELFSYFLFVTSLAGINTWLYNSSRGSVLVTILFHLFGNAGLLLLFFPALKNDYKLVYTLSTLFLSFFTILLYIFTGFGRKTTTGLS